jgi:ribosomal protein S11
MSKKREKKTQEKTVAYYGPPGVRETELVFGVAHIYASFNNTFVVRYFSHDILIPLARN